MYYNVTSDWNAYWTRCEFCGNRYHRSDGGCDCTDYLEDCACGTRDWNIEHDELLCAVCRTEPGSEDN